MKQRFIPPARVEARKLLERFQVKSTPVDVERIAYRLGVRIQFAPFDGDLSGMAYVKDGLPIIGVNSLHHRNRQRFTIAHELGHVCMHRELLERKVHLDRGILRRDSLAATGTDRVEIEANAFASELLVPEALLLSALGGRTLDVEDDHAVVILAKQFRVSDAVMRFRLLSFD